jgi:hypothetical protein
MTDKVCLTCRLIGVQAPTLLLMFSYYSRNFPVMTDLNTFPFYHKFSPEIARVLVL